MIEDHIRRLRSQLLRALDWQHMKPEPPEIPVTRSVTVDLTFIDIAIEELKPSYMRGCGAVPEDAVDELNGVVHELRSLAGSMERYLRQELGTNLESRLKKLEETGYDVALLRLIEATRHSSRVGGVPAAHRFACVPPGGQQPGSGAVRTCQQWKILPSECAPEHRRSSRRHQPHHRCTHEIALWSNTAR